MVAPSNPQRVDESIRPMPARRGLALPRAGRLARRGVACRARERRARARRGSALVEFALIAFAFYLLLAGTIELGRMIFSAQILQGAARAGARELAIVPLPATMTFSEALADPVVRQRVYDPTRLALDITGMDDAEVQELLDGLPVINKLLAPLMIRDDAIVSGRTLMRYPGALFSGPEGYLVAIPRVLDRAGNGGETIEWLPVVEEIVPDPDDPATAPFSLTSTGPHRGLVALRIHYPFQAATLSAYRQEEGPNGSVRNLPIENSGVVAVVGDYSPGSPLQTSAQSGAYAGAFGLGSLEAVGEKVRPFRRLLSHQSIFRREVFSQ